MIKRVTKFYGESSTNPTQLAEGITFDEFRSFYHVLYCGADFERAMYFYDLDHGGITKGQFVELSQWISDMEVDSHLVDVIFPTSVKFAGETAPYTLDVTATDNAIDAVALTCISDSGTVEYLANVSQNYG